uniref:Uncharacterized protein n=1 Tax=Anguilla anguilla TaxID=7936 RepID=A0A0E9TLL0_ANGAN
MCCWETLPGNLWTF